MGITVLVSNKDYSDKIAACYHSPFKFFRCYKVPSVHPAAGDVFEIKLYIQTKLRGPTTIAPFLPLCMASITKATTTQKRFSSFLKS